MSNWPSTKASPRPLMISRSDSLDELYRLLADLERRCGGKRRLATCDGKGWPKRGVYFFFEEGEFREDGHTPRVVRVGTHALRPSSTTLWNRLSQHKGNSGGSRPGGGNHRGSIFRLHVGTALMAQGEWPDSVTAHWGVGSGASGLVRTQEYPLECAVSARIGTMPFLWLAVDDPPGPKSNRGVIEAGSIRLLSNYRRIFIDPPSPGWLGHLAGRDSVRLSGLWNVHHVAEQPDPDFLDVFARYVAATELGD